MRVELAFREWCFERRERVERSVYRMWPSAAADAGWFYEKLQGKPSLFQAERLTTPESLVVLDHPRLYWLLVDTVGILAANFSPDVDLGLDVHVTFWDSILRGREALCRRALRQAADHFGASRAFTALVPSNRTGIAFAQRCGFRLAGVRPLAGRNAKGETEDLAVFVTDFTV